ncbi:MAG: glutamate--tRNA ligase, partial [Candidatus Dormibacteraceae bacterium]
MSTIHPPRVRLAPSPTGFVHLGNARTFLYNLLFARGQGGSVVLRLDDTDAERDRPEHETNLYSMLHWLGLKWDEGPDIGGESGPYRQSQRQDIYRQHAARLLQAGAAYRCFCTQEELDAERNQAQASKQPYRYSRRCLEHPPSGREEFIVRLKIPEGETSFHDLVRGEVSFQNQLIGDPVLVRRSGVALYNFSSAIDDGLMRISHIIRGEEHLSNTPIQLILLAALDLPRPTAFAHLPVIVGPDRQKLSKRRHPEARLGLYQEQGYLPQALLNYLALLGWNPGSEQEFFTLEELIQTFSLERVQSSGAQFDGEKLEWLNGLWIRQLSDADLTEQLIPFLPQLPIETIRAAAPGLKERLPRLDKAAELLAYLTEPPPLPPLSPP